MNKMVKNNADGIETVQTKSGPIRGFISHGKNGEPVATYYGIPYAEPPIGQLRFKPPVPIGPWTKTFAATEVPNTCPQLVRAVKGSTCVKSDEDCLRLNIWVPLKTKCKLPVMVFIHGGAFVEGTSLSTYVNGVNLTASQGVIFVTVNYRLGPFGFMYLGEELKNQVQGNAGLFDQQLALKWVRDNIEFFGGDSGNVTLFGCSAGSASVGMHLMSPSSRGLFQRAIMMSGSPANPRVVRDKEVLLDTVHRLLDYLGYEGSRENKGRILRFLRSVDCHVLAAAGRVGTNGLLSVNNFGPIVDGVFLPKNPIDSLNSLQFESNVDLLIGNVSDEVISFYKTYFKELFHRSDHQGLTTEEHIEVIRILNNRGLTEDEITQCSDYYRYSIDPNDPLNPLLMRDTALAIVSDALYNIDVELFAESYCKAGNNVYKYLFDQKLPDFKFPKYSGAFHISDQMVILGLAKMHHKNDSLNAKSFENEMAERWANFARNGNPNLNYVDSLSEKWLKYEEEFKFYAILKQDGLTISQCYRGNVNNFWRNKILK